MILIIQGSGGLGRETMELAKYNNEKNNKYEDILFCDDWASNTKNGVKIYSYDYIKKNIDSKSCKFVIAVGEPRIRKKEYYLKINDGFDFDNLIHCDIYIPPSVNLGKGNIVFNYVCISPNVVMNDNIIIYPLCSINHDVIIGSHSVVCSMVALTGGVQIGNSTFLGVNSSVKQRVCVGNDVIVGMGANVINDVEDNHIVYGNPAKAYYNLNKKTVF